MFCLSCGKKITDNSKFCKYCGSNQTTKKKVNKKEYEAVWTCDYCNTEFPSKKLSDKHEIICVNNPKNNKFPFNTNPKKGWIVFWLTTITVFILTCFISAKFVEKGVTLLNRDILSAMFLGNICLGVIAFFCIAFSRSKPKNNKLNGLIKYSLIICLIYLIINPSILAVEGYKAIENEQYKNKYYSKQIPTPTLTPQDSTDKLLKDLNDYRTEQKMNVLTLDQEMCQVAERLSKMEKLEGALKKSDYIDLCPKCSGVGYAYIENVPLTNIFSKFKEKAEIKKVIDNKNYKYACFAINNQRIQLFIGNKTTSSKTNTIANNSGNIECIGPDGKNFWTSMDECKKLNENWGKPLDYMTNCVYPAECGGGTKRESKSECDKPCTRITNNTNNNGNQIVYVPQNTSNNSNKTAVFLTYSQYTIYCPSQNVGAVMTIDSTMKSKSMDWAKDYNDCADRFRNNDPCWSTCKTAHTDGWNQCTAIYGYSGTEKDSCTNKVGDEYSACISKCPSPSSPCDYVYAEQKNLSSQINNLCK